MSKPTAWLAWRIEQRSRVFSSEKTDELPLRGHLASCLVALGIDACLRQRMYQQAVADTSQSEPSDIVFLRAT
ncbi:MAG: hypothetical protein Q7S11_03680 [bacterium]|nr:hypothetical protein [bacterium]